MVRPYIQIISIALILASPLAASAAGFARVGTAGFTWEGIYASARLSALGGSDMADGGPAALLINPAPLSVNKVAELSYDHADYFAGTEISTIAGAVGLKGWCLNFAVHDYSIDDALLRTAYNPEGTGEFFDILQRMTLLGASYDIGRHLFGHRSLQWSVGAVWRHYLSDYDDNSAQGDSYDLGSTARWSMQHDNGWSRITGAFSYQNIKDETIEFDERYSSLPQPMRLGLTLETAIARSGHGGSVLRFLMAYSRCYQLGDSYAADSGHTGVEAVLYDTLALRWGHSDRVAGGISSWGLGVTLDEQLPGPFAVVIDVGGMGYDNLVTTEGETIWGVRVGYKF
jgi:hypothetical protein